MKRIKILLTCLAFFIIYRCSSIPNPPLLFGQQQTLGLSIAGSPTDQSAELTLGYKDRNFAIIPVTVKQAGGDSTQVSAKAGDNFEDALSVLGQFEVNAKAANTGVSLGKFFATGVAAQKLSDGFASKLGKEPDTE